MGEMSTAANVTSTSTRTRGDEVGSGVCVGRRKKKIFPTAHLTNDERDELHVEIFRYFKWLRDSLSSSLSSSSSSSSAHAHTTFDYCGTALNSEGIDNSDAADVVVIDPVGGGGGERMKRSLASVSGGGVGYTAGGIKLSSLENLMEDMISTFKVVRNDQANESLSSSSSSSCSTNGMPFLEEALGEPLGRLAAIARRDHYDRRDQLRNNNRRRSGGLDFNDMFERLVRFHKEHGHVNVPQKYARDGQLGSWVANIRSKRKQMARKGEDFEPDVLASDDDIDDDNNDHDEDDDEALLAMEHEGGEGDLGGGDIVENGAGGEGKVNDGKKRKRNGGRQRLTRDRVERLDGIGFQWVVANPNTKSWEERFEDLREYQRMNGSTRVPRSGALGEWVHMQRRLYNKKDKNFLASRAPMLDDIGFEWHPRKHTVVSFEDNFRRLVEFGRINGHYDVPFSLPEGYRGDIDGLDRDLSETHRFAKWVKRLHAEYRSYASGKGSRMLNDARIMQLREVGLEFY
ncbi:hypothetical protein ACHAXA_001580 [Cyclostephanos tholiformis]|uniref:Helicase-associated domain-containing protein n=1 Tax=Cyclostephanos tholiformis TaxID=382380 RepID=A0ABD3RGC8_9STRA